MHDMQALTALTPRSAAALTVWDLAHSAGAVPVDLHQAGADFAIGCTYKYLNGGPGSPAFVWVSPRCRDLRAAAAVRVVRPLRGSSRWSPRYEPRRRHRPLTCAAPSRSPYFGDGGMRAGSCSRQTDMASLRAKSLALTDLFIRTGRTALRGSRTGP